MESMSPKMLFLLILQSVKNASGGDDTVFLTLAGMLVACGLIYGFFGYRGYRWLLMLFGACLGTFVGLLLSDWTLVFHSLDPFYVQVTFIVLMAVCGAVIAPKFFFLVTFIVGGIAFALALFPVMTALSAEFDWLLSIACFVGGGLLALLLIRPTLITATSILGSFLVTSVFFAAAVHFNWLNNKFHFFLFYGCWLLVSLFGISFQALQKTGDMHQQFTKDAPMLAS